MVLACVWWTCRHSKSNLKGPSHSRTALAGNISIALAYGDEVTNIISGNCHGTAPHIPYIYRPIHK
jgi:hypothetical protein